MRITVWWALMYYLIYKITCISNGKIYVGAHKTHDLNDNYMGSGKLLKRTQRKDGLATVKRLIKHSKEHAERLKTNEEYRKEFSEKVKNGVGAGNFLGKKHSIQTRKKMSESCKGKHKGNNNSMFGKCWVFNEDTFESKPIPKECLNDYLAKGWQRGRKIKKATI